MLSALRIVSCTTSGPREITVTSLPAFFVDVPMFIKALVGVSVVWTVAAVVLMFSGDRHTVPVVD